MQGGWVGSRHIQPRHSYEICIYAYDTPFLVHLQGSGFGETLMKPDQYKSLLKTTCTVGQCFYKFAIHWQPGWVMWIVNNRVIRRSYYDQSITW